MLVFHGEDGSNGEVILGVVGGRAEMFSDFVFLRFSQYYVLHVSIPSIYESPPRFPYV